MSCIFWQRKTEDNQTALNNNGTRLSTNKDRFLRDILSTGENEVSPKDGESTKFPPIGQDKNSNSSKMAALPAIYVPSNSRFQVRGMPRRVGGGFNSSSEAPRYSSAPTGLVEYLSLQGRPLDI